MQVRLSTQFPTLFKSLLRNPWSAAGICILLLCLAGCGGSAASSNMAQTQTPTLQPDNTTGISSSTPSSPGSSNDSSSGSSSPSNSGSSPSQSSPSQSSTIPGVPAGAKTTYAVQTLPDWQWCTAKLHGHPCASGEGDATSSMTPNQDNPSLSGKSSHFTLGGETRYSNALWWKQLGHDSKSVHFVYDLYFYIKSPNAPEALEFDVNQSMGGQRWTWGTECSYRDSGHWDIWDPEAEKWETTSVSCPPVAANQWHHLTWQVERVNGKAHYISVTLDGDVHQVDKYYNPQQHFHGDGISVAFQLDGNYRQDPYSVWLDNVSLSSW